MIPSTFTALEDIKIDKIDFDWIQSTTKLSHLKRAIKVIQLDGDYYPQLKQECYKRIEELDPTQKRKNLSNHISLQTRNQIQNQLEQWASLLENKQKSHKVNNNTQPTAQTDLSDFQKYFSNQEASSNLQRKTKLAQNQRIKGNQAIKSKDYQQAINYYTASIALDPKMHISYCNRALVYLKTKQYDKCINDCEQTLSLNKTYVKAYHRKAKALMGLNRKVEAYRCLQQGQKLQPQNIELTKQLKELREELSPDQVKQLQSHLIPARQFKKITIQQDDQQDD